MIRWLMISALGMFLLAGCGDSPRVERRALIEPEAAHGMKQPGSGMMSEASPHGMGMKTPTLSEAELASEEVTLGTIHLRRAKTWVRKPPRSELIHVEFSLPHAEGDTADGRLTVSTAGGSMEDNILRWRQQFTDKPKKESQEKLDVAGLQVTVVDFSGTFNDQRGPFAPAVECPDYRMFGAIFDVGGKLHFIKCYGPSKTMAARADEFRTFVKSLKRD